MDPESIESEDEQTPQVAQEDEEGFDADDAFNPFASPSNGDSQPDSWKLPEEISVNSDYVSEFSHEPVGDHATALNSTSTPASVRKQRRDEERGMDAPPSVIHEGSESETIVQSKRFFGGITHATSNTSFSTTQTTDALKRRLIVWASIALVMLIALILMIMFVTGSIGQNKEPSSANEPEDDLTPRERALMEILSGVSPTGLHEVGSPQKLARDWLFHDDKLQLTPQEGVSNTTIVQRYVLMVFYFSTSGPSWHEHAEHNWLEGEVCASIHWKGVSCTYENEVRALAFDNEGLDGTIPDEIGHLTKLENLVLKNHQKLTGSIPTTIGNLKRLGQLGLYNNGLIGGLPRELYDATYLNYINLENNQLIGGLTLAIEKLRNLEKLILFNNKFSGGVPFTQLARTGIRLLGLSGNDFEGTLPESIQDLPLLEYLYLDGNRFRGTLPSTIGKLRLLKSLMLDSNEFTGELPSEVGTMRSIEFFSMQGNRLRGSLPTEINDMAKLGEYD
mmetsp:Transcript_18389/g.27324  ORF Transcript_18389/g.27324 Transcript_18389/m.27324 type:complete len:505 (-) Transcript_18389:742-2256(-)